MSTLGLTVCRFVHKHQNAFFCSNFSHSLEVELLTVNWSIFKTPVTSINQYTKWRTDNNRCCVRNRVVNSDKLDIEAIAKLNLFVRFRIKLVVVWLVAACRFFHRALNHTKSKFTSVNRCRNLVDNVTECTDVIKVSVRKDNATNFVLILFKVADIRCDVVDTRVI
ncbi:hypothetical protein D3C72_1777260 [compost metagenome]